MRVHACVHLCMRASLHACIGMPHVHLIYLQLCVVQLRPARQHTLAQRADGLLPSCLIFKADHHIIHCGLWQSLAACQRSAACTSDVSARGIKTLNQVTRCRACSS